MVCPACGEQSPDKAKFCSECGAQLAEPPAQQEERKVVTVLFADLVGFTSRSEQMDVEDVRGTLQPYHHLLRRELERHGGTVEKFIGDAVMALFGAPTAHEDDPERAVRAALAIQDAVARLREEDPKLDLHVRIGVNTGEALIVLGARPAEGEGMASGDVVNTAARLQSAALVDGVLVGEVTYRATDRAIRYADAESVVAKGKADPIRVWQALEPRSMLPEQTRIDDLRLVGRETELGLLVGGLERACGEPATQLVTVVGAPGIGKTRLVYELFLHIDERPDSVRWRRGRSLAYGEGIAFWALGEMVKAEAGILESDSAEVTADKLDDAVAAVMAEEHDHEWVVRHVRPLVGLDAVTPVSVESGRLESFAAWRRFFEALAEDGPTVLVFEDLHWGDDGLLDFIDLLAERAGEVPLLIVCTTRPELLERRAGWSGGKTNTQTLLLSPLSDEDTARLVGELLDQALLPADTQRALLVRAQGNPLYAQEYVRMLRDRGMLAQEGGGWRLIGEPEELPESVQAIIAARLDTLSEAERRLIQDAAVVGKTAWLGAVCAISDMSPWQADEVLHGLERKQLLRRARRSSVAGEVEFSFAHALTQEVAYNQIRRPERAHRHERAAAWMEHLSGERDDKAELLAHHYTTALNLRHQAGEETSDIANKARSALVEAGKQAQAVNAHAAAARHFAAAIDLSTAEDPIRRRLLLDLATASYHAGIADETMLRSALDAQVSAANWSSAAEACVVLAEWLDTYAGHGQEAEQIVSRAYEYATRGGYSPLSSRIAYDKAWRLVVTGRSQEALEVTEAAIRDAERAGDETGRALLRIWHGASLVEAGDASGVQELRDASIVLARNEHPKTPIAFSTMAEAYIGLGEFSAAARARDELAHWAERFGQAYQVGYAQTGQAEDAYHSGDWKQALELSLPLIDHPAGQVASAARWVRGRLAIASGEITTAIDDANRITNYAIAGGNDEVLFFGRALSAIAYHRTDDGSESDNALNRFLDRWRQVGGMLSSAYVLAEVSAAIGDRDSVRQAAALLPQGTRWREALTTIVEHRYTDSAQAFQEIGSQPLQAGAYLLAAHQAADARQTAQSAQFAEQALSFYRRVEAVAYIREAERLLQRTATA
jgi:predicted ATPase/class 3 adenylate cyclase